MTALWLRTTLWKQLLGHPRAMPGAWGRFALHRILPRKEFMGSAKRLGYGCGEVDALPSSLTESFCGAGNPAHRARTTGRPVRAVLRYARSRAQPRSAHLVRQS